MNFATLRLGKDSVADIGTLDRLPAGSQPTPYQFVTSCTQVPEAVDAGSLVFIWFGSDNSKGKPTSWPQGFRAIGRILSVEGTNYRESSDLTVSVGYVFKTSIGRKDFLRECPEGYFWCSDVPIIGLDDRANQTVRMIDDETQSSVGALLYCLASCEKDLAENIAIPYPELLPYLAYLPPDPKVGVSAGGQPHPVTNSELSRNVIYFGAPGTGKSYQLDRLAKAHFSELDPDSESRQARVTFHPRYTYYQFVGSYKPVSRETLQVQQGEERTREEISYAFVPGPFTNMLVKALNHREHSYLLILEEVNRADTAGVFGDIFQLLDRNRTGSSTYPIEVSEELGNFISGKLTEDGIAYLRDLGGRKNTLASGFQIVLPPNLFLWATMNSADQGVFPLDSAFKRRWDFEYVGINDGADQCTWDRERRIINHLLKSVGRVNEDKLIGPFFLSTSMATRSADGSITKEFSAAFANKVLMYLVEDAAKYSMQDIVTLDSAPEHATLSDYFSSWNAHNFGIFDGLEPWKTTRLPGDPSGHELAEGRDELGAAPNV